MSTQDEIEQMLKDCENRESKLTEWEGGFIDSLSRQFTKTHSISARQDEILVEIWDRVTS